MILDSPTATQLYIEYINTQDPKLLAEIHKLADSFIQVIAYSLHQPAYQDDLVQEGHLKMHILLSSMQFRTNTTAALYSYLDPAIRNCMIDYLRKQHDYVNIDDVTIMCAEPFHYAVYQSDAFDAYYATRFPSLRDCYLCAEYARDAVMEAVNRNKAVTTLFLYTKTRQQALTVYRSVQLFLRTSSLMDIPQQTLSTSLSHATNGHEFTLYPESILIGCDECKYNQLVAYVNKLRASLRLQP
jgi:DNA-directed RNA polymerase specialized sigma24 family protein